MKDFELDELVASRSDFQESIRLMAMQISSEIRIPPGLLMTDKQGSEKREQGFLKEVNDCPRCGCNHVRAKVYFGKTSDMPEDGLYLFEHGGYVPCYIRNEIDYMHKSMRKFMEGYEEGLRKVRPNNPEEALILKGEIMRCRKRIQESEKSE